MAGYSGTPLPKKLGIKEGHRIALLHAPDDLDQNLGDLPTGVQVRRDLRGKQTPDVIVTFLTRQARLEQDFEKLAARLQKDGGLWIAWPKKASGKPTDLSDGIVRKIGLASGLVDNKVCAVDAIWSALRFVYRVKDR